MPGVGGLRSLPHVLSIAALKLGVNDRGVVYTDAHALEWNRFREADGAARPTTQPPRRSIVSRRAPLRRIASLAAFAQRLLADAHDDAIDVFLIVSHDTVSRSERVEEQDRLRTLDQLDAAANILRRAALVVLDTSVQDADVRAKLQA